MATPAVAWCEVTGKDGTSLQDFDGRLFDWKINDADDGPGYGPVAAADNGIAGGIGAAQDGGIRAWRVPVSPTRRVRPSGCSEEAGVVRL